MNTGSGRFRVGYDAHVPVSADKAVERFIAKRLRELYRVKPADTTRAKSDEITPRGIAKDLGVSYPQVVEVLAGRGGVGKKFEAQFAAKFYGGSIDKLRSAALAWAEQNSEEAEPTERYAVMPAVQAMARAKGFDAAFVDTWEVQLDADEQPDVDDLWTLCKADYARWSGKAKRAPGDPLDGIDERPRKRK